MSEDRAVWILNWAGEIFGTLVLFLLFSPWHLIPCGPFSLHCLLIAWCARDSCTYTEKSGAKCSVKGSIWNGRVSWVVFVLLVKAVNGSSQIQENEETNFNSWESGNPTVLRSMCDGKFVVSSLEPNCLLTHFPEPHPASFLIRTSSPTENVERMWWLQPPTFTADSIRISSSALIYLFFSPNKG